MSSKFRHLLAACALMFLVAQGGGDEAFASQSALQSQDAAALRRNEETFNAAINILARRYYDPARLAPGTAWASMVEDRREAIIQAPDQTAFYRELNRLLAILGDQHTYVIAPARTPARPGVSTGLWIIIDGDRYVVHAVSPNSPAELAGVEMGWVVESVDGRPFEPGSINRAIEPEVRLVTTSGDRRTIRLRPSSGWRPTQAVVEEVAGKGWVLRLPTFGRGSARIAEQALAQLPQDAPLVLDLRGNMGGQRTEFLRLASCMVPRDTVVIRVRERSGREIVRRTSGRCEASWQGPLVILVDESTASAGEAFAAAMQDAGRGRVVGRRSAGAVLGARDQRLPDGGTMSVSMLDIQRPAGGRLEGVGVTPDVEAKTTGQDRQAGRDPALEAAFNLANP